MEEIDKSDRRIRYYRQVLAFDHMGAGMMDVELPRTNHLPRVHAHLPYRWCVCDVSCISFTPTVQARTGGLVSLSHTASRNFSSIDEAADRFKHFPNQGIGREIGLASS